MPIECNIWEDKDKTFKRTFIEELNCIVLTEQQI